MNEGMFSGSFTITKHPFTKDAVKELEDRVWAKSLWPLVYIISDKDLKKAYVGESTNAMSRLRTHLFNEDRNQLSNLHLITSDKFNKSAALDIEANLIRYIDGDGRYELQNGNAGLVLHNYYQRRDYLKLFREIWTDLKKQDIALKSLEDIDNTDLFKYSPYKSLTEDQYSAIERIIEVLIGQPRSSVFVKGSAGTGKTILAVFLIKLLKTDLPTLFDTDDLGIGDNKVRLIRALKEKFPDPKVALVVPMTSLRNTLKKVFKNVKGLNAGMVIGPSEVAKGKYDILLIDEAHRMRRRVNITNYKSFDDNNKLFGFDDTGTELDWVRRQSDHQIFFYDHAQSIKPSDIPKESFDRLLAQAQDKIELKSQLRVKGGEDYITYIDKLMNVELPPDQPLFESEDYDLAMFDSLQQREKELRLCRLVAGYSWEWRSKNKDVHDIEIEGIKLKWNSEASEWITSANAINEVGCIHTTQGYDLNYTAVIFGKEISYDPDKNEITVIPGNYHDRNGKSGIKDPKILKAYIMNIYKTLMFRGIRGTYIYIHDEKLREYFKKHIPLFSSWTPKILPMNEVQQFVNSVPIYDLKVAAGGFSDLQSVEDQEWVMLPPHIRPHKDHFVCRVVGDSMNKSIPNGSWCLFKREPGGSRQGKIVLVQHHQLQDADFGSGYTVKVYHSEKKSGEGRWEHETITLSPNSNDPSYKDIILKPEKEGELKIIGEFVCVLNNQ